MLGLIKILNYGEKVSIKLPRQAACPKTFGAVFEAGKKDALLTGLAAKTTVCPELPQQIADFAISRVTKPGIQFIKQN